MTTLLSNINQLLSPYYSNMSMVIIATLLVIYGDLFNKHVKRLLSPYPFVVRSAFFAIICGFGYGALTLWGAPLVQRVIMLTPSLYQGISFIGVFLLLGVLAEKRNYI